MTAPSRLPGEQSRARLAAGAPLVFVHIPKTAGTSFRDILQQRFRDDETCPPYLHAELPSVKRYEMGRYRLVRGHFFYGVLKRLLPPETVYITFLRDPIERAISTYAHLQNKPEVGVQRPWGPGTDLETFISHPLAIDVITNLQSRTLASEFSFATVEQVPEDVTAEAREALLGKYPPAAAAMRALDEMAYFGLTERFADSLRLLGHTFGWQPLADVGALNVAPRRPLRQRLPQPLLDRLIELNQEDLQLYAYAKQLFEDRVRGLDDAPPPINPSRS